YVPGTGPQLQRPRLVPTRDSRAYIMDRVLLPSAGPARDRKPLLKRMKYMVGWHHSSSASLLVPAMEVLHYVSLQALEEWEYEIELELDEERVKREEKNMKTKQPKARGRALIKH
ncbi:hypothetical protein BGZ61DRAFT_364137, partial [Ilyonectria robusta]|uniref:uncharacterized protein n=1 Tax=Ilyonectria robusta TaxID=1079257 RepID=UPI001E8D6A73